MNQSRQLSLIGPALLISGLASLFGPSLNRKAGKPDFYMPRPAFFYLVFRLFSKWKIILLNPFIILFKFLMKKKSRKRNNKNLTSGSTNTFPIKITFQKTSNSPKHTSSNPTSSPLDSKKLSEKKQQKQTRSRRIASRRCEADDFAHAVYGKNEIDSSFYVPNLDTHFIRFDFILTRQISFCMSSMNWKQWNSLVLFSFSNKTWKMKLNKIKVNVYYYEISAVLSPE